MRASKPGAVVLALMAVAFAARVSAHRLDEFLQAARIAVERDRVQLEMSLTPGAAVAEGVFREIDVDRNGVLSGDEQQAYAARVIQALTLCLDDSPPLQMQAASVSFPDPAALRAGDGVIAIRAEAAVSRLPIGPHRLVFHNRHAEGDSVYLANALVPEDDEVAVTGQQRTGNQSALTIEFDVRAASAPSGWWVWIAATAALVLAASLVSRRQRLPIWCSAS